MAPAHDDILNAAAFFVDAQLAVVPVDSKLCGVTTFEQQTWNPWYLGCFWSSPPQTQLKAGVCIQLGRCHPPPPTGALRKKPWSSLVVDLLLLLWKTKSSDPPRSWMRPTSWNHSLSGCSCRILSAVWNACTMFGKSRSGSLSSTWVGPALIFQFELGFTFQLVQHVQRLHDSRLHVVELQPCLVLLHHKGHCL